MTDQIFDDRAGAYVGAREALKAANQIKVQTQRAATVDPEDGQIVVDELGDEYWSLIAEAAVLSNLARADATVGFLAGNYLVDQQKRIKRNRQSDLYAQARSFRERIKDADEPPRFAGPPWAEGQHVRLNAGDYAGRTGRIYETHLDSELPTVDVELDPPGRPDDPAEPILATVRANDVELADV